MNSEEIALVILEETFQQELQYNQSSSNRKRKATTQLPQKDEILQSIESKLQSVLHSLETTGDATFEFPSRKHTTYDYETETNLSNPSKVVKISFKSLKTSKTFVIMLRILDLIHILLQHNLYTTKRDLYYMDTALFQSQTSSDSAIENLASMFQIPRSYLNVVATEKGLVFGDVSWQEPNHPLVSSLHPSFSSTGRLLPSNPEDLQNLTTQAQICIIIEDHATFTRLLRDEFIQNFTETKVLLVTGRGYPDVATRQFLRKLKDQNPGMITLALVDWDIWGLEILSVYSFGSAGMNWDVERLAVPEIKWIGVHWEDIQGKIGKKGQRSISEKDTDKITKMISREEIKQGRPKWRKEMEQMITCGFKVEIEALSEISLSFVSEFLREKIKNKSWK